MPALSHMHGCEWMLLDLEEASRLTLRPDAVHIATLSHDAAAEAPRTRAEKSQHLVDLMEFGYGSDTRRAGKTTEKQAQHELLLRLLLEAGWKDVKLWIFPFGTLGATHSSFLPSLVALGLTTAAARSSSQSCPAMQCMPRKPSSARRGS